MKVLIGIDVGVYKFDPVNSVVYIYETPAFALEQVLLITNVTTGQIIFNFADSTLKATLSGSALTLQASMAGMAYTDNLQIFMQFPDKVTNVNEGVMKEIVQTLRQIRFGIGALTKLNLEEVE